MLHLLLVGKRGARASAEQETQPPGCKGPPGPEADVPSKQHHRSRYAAKSPYFPLGRPCGCGHGASIDRQQTLPESAAALEQP